MKHKFWGIGATGAAIIVSGLAATPATAFLANGIIGKIIFYIAKLLCAYLANLGLIVLNVGSAKLETITESGTFDGSWESADELIKKIRDTGRELTDEEIKAIDGPVIDAFRKFAGFGRVHQLGNTEF